MRHAQLFFPMKLFLTRLFMLIGAASLVACSSKSNDEETPAQAPVQTAAAATAPAPAPAPAAAPASAAPAAEPTAPAGFDVNAVPVASPKLGAFPYFSILDGYHKGSVKDPEVSHDKFNDLFKDVAFDRYEFFDGVKLIPVEGRLTTFEAIGKGASFFQVEKTYEKLVHDLGGVTVWEGNMEKFKDAKLKMDEERHRGRFGMWSSEKAGVYMVRATDREIWVEVYQRYDDPAGYWLTVVEKKALPMQASVLPAEALKKELDSKGHVALYLNFDTDQATLRPDAQPAVAQIIALLAANPSLNLTVEGHTDNSGTPAHIQELSEARARTVVATLTAQGVAANRLKSAGCGQTKPLADNATEEGKAKNRRVELVR